MKAKVIAKAEVPEQVPEDVASQSRRNTITTTSAYVILETKR